MKTAEQLYKEYMMEINADTEGKNRILIDIERKETKRNTPKCKTDKNHNRITKNHLDTNG